MTGSPHALQFAPHMTDGFKRLVGVVGFDGYQLGIAQAKEVLDKRPAILFRVLIGKHKQSVVLTFRDCRCQFLM